MVRDFTEQARQELLDLVEQVEKEKWCDFTDWLGDRWYDFQEWIGKLDIKNYVDNKILLIRYCQDGVYGEFLTFSICRTKLGT